MSEGITFDVLSMLGLGGVTVTFAGGVFSSELGG